MRCRGSLASTTGQSPVSSAASRATVSSAGLAEPGTRQVLHSIPPAAGLNDRCGPTSPQRAQPSNVGA